jgi:hypothetical protein
MEKQEFKSKWDDLAREIGAEVSAETEQREQTVFAVSESVTSQAKAEEVEEIARAPLPKKQAADWNQLAGELGLPPVSYEEPVAEEQPQAEERPVFRESLTPMSRSDRGESEEREEREEREPVLPRREEGRDRGDRGERGGRGGERQQSQRGDRERSGRQRGGRGRRDDGGRGREESGRGRDESARGRGNRGRGRDEAGRGRDDSRGDRDEQRRSREPRETRERSDRDDQRYMEFSEEVQETTEVESMQIESTPPPAPEPPPKSPAVSLWHKIFGSPAEQTAKLPEPEPSEPAWNDDLRSESPAPVFDETFGTPSEELAGGEFDDMSSRGERTIDEEEDASAEDRKRGRSRRRRRGGRGRRPGERREERSAAPLQPESEGIDDLGVELDGDDDADIADLGSQLDDEEGDGDTADVGGRRGSAAQRAIPSWDEAIGFIVDSNMQSRSQRRPAPRSGNGPRGRSRGRRRS